MRKISILLALVALVTISNGARAQSPASVVNATVDSTSAKAAQPSADQALSDLQKAATDLSKAVEVAAAKVANSPELKVAALQVAAGAVSLAQQSLADQLKVIEAALGAAARQIAIAQASLPPKK